MTLADALRYVDGLDDDEVGSLLDEILERCYMRDVVRLLIHARPTTYTGNQTDAIGEAIAAHRAEVQRIDAEIAEAEHVINPQDPDEHDCGDEGCWQHGPKDAP